MTRFSAIDPQAASTEAAIALTPSGCQHVDAFYSRLANSPELAALVRSLMDYMSIGLRLPEPLRAVAVLVAAAKHSPVSAKFFAAMPEIQAAGLPAATVESLVRKERPEGMAGDQAMIHDYCIQIRDNGRVDNAAFAPVNARFGAAICLEIAVLMGSTATMSMLANVINGSTSLA